MQCAFAFLYYVNSNVGQYFYIYMKSQEMRDDARANKNLNSKQNNNK